VIEYKGYDIKYDNYRDDKWPNGCYVGIKYVWHPNPDLSHTGDSKEKTEKCNTLDEVKIAIDNIIQEKTESP